MFPGRDQANGPCSPEVILSTLRELFFAVSRCLVLLHFTSLQVFDQAFTSLHSGVWFLRNREKWISQFYIHALNQSPNIFFLFNNRNNIYIYIYIYRIRPLVIIVTGFLSYNTQNFRSCMMFRQLAGVSVSTKPQCVSCYRAFSIVSLIAFEMWQVTEVWIAWLHEQFLCSP